MVHLWSYLRKQISFIPHKTIISGPNSFLDSEASCINAESYSEVDKEKILKELESNDSIAKIDKYIKKAHLW